MHEHLPTGKAWACSMSRKTSGTMERGLHIIFSKKSQEIISAEGENFVAFMTVAGLLEYLPCLLVPEHEIKVAHGDADGFGEFLHLYFCCKVLSSA
jgi:hypothetical protein